MTIAVIDIMRAAAISLGAGFGCALILLMKSVTDFSRTGPQISNEIIGHYVSYTAYAVARLFLWAAVVLSCLGWIGNLVYLAITVLVGGKASSAWMVTTQVLRPSESIRCCSSPATCCLSPAACSSFVAVSFHPTFPAVAPPDSRENRSSAACSLRPAGGPPGECHHAVGCPVCVSASGAADVDVTAAGPGADVGGVGSRTSACQQRCSGPRGSPEHRDDRQRHATSGPSGARVTHAATPAIGKPRGAAESLSRMPCRWPVRLPAWCLC